MTERNRVQEMADESLDRVFVRLGVSRVFDRDHDPSRFELGGGWRLFSNGETTDQHRNHKNMQLGLTFFISLAP